MKKLFTMFVITAIAIGIFAQSPQKMSYQAVIRNSTGQLVADHEVGMRISILQGTSTGSVVYQEIFNPNPRTNPNGLVTIEIGGGIPVTGIFSSISWTSGSYFLKTETDPTGGTSYTVVGTSQLLSVPYALHARSAAVYNETDPVFGASPAKGITSGNITNWTTAYGWGNHAGLYRPVGWVPGWSDITGKPAFAAVATSGSYNDLINKPAILTPGGATGNVQFNNAGVLGGDANLTWDNSNKTLGIGLSNPYYQLHVTGSNVRSIHGETTYGGGAAIFGVGNSVSGSNVGVRGQSNSTNGAGVWGDALASTGTTYGIKGMVNSADGFSGYFTGGKFYVQGNVGIGDLSPDAKLDVEGTVNIGGTNASELNRAQTSAANLVPIAYGQVHANGTFSTAAGTPNFTVTRSGVGVYDITITGESIYYYNYTVSGTLIGPGPGFIIAGSASNMLRFSVYNTAGAAMDRAFYFIVYKP